MNLKALSLVGWMILVLAATPCLAARIPSVTASTNMGAGFGTDIQNTVNGVGLSSLSLTAPHDGTSPSNSWVSTGTLTGTVTFDFGGNFLVNSFSFWNQNGGGPGANGSTGIQGVAVATSMDGITFTPLSGGPTSFAQVMVSVGATPQTFNFTPVSGRFFRFTILSNYGDPSQTGFGEAGFDAGGPTPTPTPTPTPGSLLNGSFETGNYTGWSTSDLANPLSPLTVRGSGFTTGFNFFSTAPTDGVFASVDGFDGQGPGNIRIAQDVVIPVRTATLTFDYRAGWDMLNYPGSTQARTLNVIVQPSGGGTNLLSTNILTAAPGTVNLDTGNKMASVNLNAFAGQSVRVIIDQFIPESFTGPGLMQIDNVRFTPAATPTLMQFSSAAFTANESTARATITVSRSGATTDVASVDFATDDNFTNAAGCAAASLTLNQRCDYATTRGTLAFAAGESSKNFTIPVTDDFYPENNETLGLTLSNPTGGALGAANTATLTISDDDATAPAESLFLARLDAAQEVPANNSTATGSGTVLLNAAENQITVNMSFTAISSGQTAAHIHGPAPVGKNAPILFTLPNGTVTNMTFAITPTQAAQLKAGLFYFNVHSNTFPNGEIRGQILPNPAENAQFFVRQQYADFLSRVPDVDDPSGLSFWTCQITGPSNVSPFCGTTPITDLVVIKQKRIAVSNAFFFENEYQQTGAFTYRLYRAAFGNTQPFPNPMGDNDSHPYCQANPNNCQLIRAAHVPSYEKFAGDRARLNASQLAASQLALATNFAQRAEFTARYPASQTADQYVDALTANIQAADGANLAGQRANLIALFNGAGGGNAGRGAVLFRLAEDNQAGNPINNRPFIDAEYNRSFVTTQYFGYLRRDADLPGLNFWLSVVNQFPLRSPTGQNGMVCAFITSQEYQLRFNSYFTRTNQTDCP